VNEWLNSVTLAFLIHPTGINLGFILQGFLDEKGFKKLKFKALDNSIKFMSYVKSTNTKV